MDMLITLLILVVIVGAIFYLINSVMPLPPVFKTVANIILVVLVLVWLLNAIGGVSGLRLR